MATATMMTAASFLSCSKATGNHSGLVSRRRLVVLANAGRGTEGETATTNGRRDLVFAAAAAAVCSVARVAAAAEEPKRGSPEARKAYAAVCISNPSATICRR
ncbi:hypothetical protein Tsubulata_000570 [Turnera subulata]|uniref:Photosystem II 5 kDa protein, chloroplastic n=1 Tax=Turnera subulata TaxID=218843 RepID=A0A9Q0FMK0_9ROSI|nr:hypothetical protein Tsubulata_000570 [Turnera subulata]